MLIVASRSNTDHLVSLARDSNLELKAMVVRDEDARQLLLLPQNESTGQIVGLFLGGGYGAQSS